ncbi:hypothetical protein [Gottfriedia solisilvae]|uniref:hypothetical protein n=1 Tax=Gottfriedia solisilvae TaxID=1516104 RepID=UPI003D2F0E4D
MDSEKNSNFCTTLVVDINRISKDRPVFAVSVKFVEGEDYSESEGKIIHLGLQTRNTSAPMIVVRNESEPKLKELMVYLLYVVKNATRI